MPSIQTQSQTTARSGGSAWVDAITASYRPLAGVYDELMDAGGAIRPDWRRFLGEIGRVGPSGFAAALASTDRHLRDSGVFYRVHGDPSGDERPWPLAPVPLLLGSAEWAALKAGAIQRARLLEHICGDIYNDAALVREGVLPAAAIAGSPDYLRPMVGVRPRGGRHLRLLAIDLGRGPDGRWWVLSDRAQAPSGAGYALENRIAVTRALPDLARNLNVERLAGFFQSFRDELTRLNRYAEARVALLTPGPFNETYFEHAYLARYLGFLLVEGGDLTVRDGAVHVRTVAGLKRVDVLWRRLDGDFADPLELNTASRLGVPGLVQALRDGGVVVGNALGSGVLESRALMSFMPAIARHVLGEELALPTMATWWCGQPRERDQVLAGLDDLALAPAFEPRMPLMPKGRPVLGASLTPDQRRQMAEHISRRGMDIVGQEVVQLSTMPVWTGSRLEPRPFTLRIFLAAVGDHDWAVMPGGFCRISGTADARYVSLQEGASASDVWVMSDQPVTETSLLTTPDRVGVRRTTGTLPSRAADNLFWLARYLERSEATLRLVRALIGRLDEAGAVASPVVSRIADLLFIGGAIDEEQKKRGPAFLAHHVLTAKGAFGAMPQLGILARHAAAVIRDRMAPDAFQGVTDFARRFEHPAYDRFEPTVALEETQRGLAQLAAFSGLASENMNRAAGWRFLDIGRRLERGVQTARMVAAFADAPPGGLDAMLELGDSQITYRARYVMTPARIPAIDLLVLDENNPRSVAFQLNRMVEHIEALPDSVVDGRPMKVLRQARRLLGELATTPIEDFDLARLPGVVTDLFALSESLSQRFFLQGYQSTFREEIG